MQPRLYNSDVGTGNPGNVFQRCSCIFEQNQGLALQDWQPSDCRFHRNPRVKRAAWVDHGLHRWVSSRIVVKGRVHSRVPEVLQGQMTSDGKQVDPHAATGWVEPLGRAKQRKKSLLSDVFSPIRPAYESAGERENRLVILVESLFQCHHPCLLLPAEACQDTVRE